MISAKPNPNDEATVDVNANASVALLAVPPTVNANAQSREDAKWVNGGPKVESPSPAELAASAAMPKLVDMVDLTTDGKAVALPEVWVIDQKPYFFADFKSENIKVELNDFCKKQGNKFKFSTLVAEKPQLAQKLKINIFQRIFAGNLQRNINRFKSELVATINGRILQEILKQIEETIILVTNKLKQIRNPESADVKKLLEIARLPDGQLANIAKLDDYRAFLLKAKGYFKNPLIWFNDPIDLHPIKSLCITHSEENGVHIFEYNLDKLKRYQSHPFTGKPIKIADFYVIEDLEYLSSQIQKEIFSYIDKLEHELETKFKSQKNRLDQLLKELGNEKSKLRTRQKDEEKATKATAKIIAKPNTSIPSLPVSAAVKPKTPTFEPMKGNRAERRAKAMAEAKAAADAKAVADAKAAEAVKEAEQKAKDEKEKEVKEKEARAAAMKTQQTAAPKQVSATAVNNLNNFFNRYNDESDDDSYTPIQNYGADQKLTEMGRIRLAAGDKGPSKAMPIFQSMVRNIARHYPGKINEPDPISNKTAIYIAVEAGEYARALFLYTNGGADLDRQNGRGAKKQTTRELIENKRRDCRAKEDWENLAALELIIGECSEKPLGFFGNLSQLNPAFNQLLANANAKKDAAIKDNPGKKLRAAAGDAKVSTADFEKMVVANKAIINEQGPEKKKTALHFAIERNEHDKIRVLLRNGAKLNITCGVPPHEKQTLQLLKEKKESGDPKYISLWKICEAAENTVQELAAFCSANPKP